MRTKKKVQRKRIVQEPKVQNERVCENKVNNVQGEECPSRDGRNAKEAFEDVRCCLGRIRRPRQCRRPAPT